MASRVTAIRAAEQRLRVVHLIAYFRVGGLERMVHALTSHAADHGVDASVVAYKGDGSFRDAFEGTGVPTHYFSTRAGIAPAFALQLAQHLMSVKADVLHTHHIGPFIYGAPAAKLARAAHIHTEHSHESYDRPRRRLVGRLMPTLAEVVCVSHEIAEWRRQTFGHRARVIPNAVPVPGVIGARPRQLARKRLGLDAGAFIVGCVGRLSPEKDHLTLIEAFRRLVDRHSDCRLVLVGGGSEEGAIRSRIESLELCGYVSLLGERYDLDEILPAFDVVTLSSKREGLPLALLEGMAHGKPVVATAVGEIPRLLDAGGGRAVPPGRPDQLAEALAHYASAPEVCYRDGELARMRIDRDHSIQAMVGAYVDMYRQAQPRSRS